NKKRIQTLQEHLNEYENLYHDSMKGKEKEIERLKKEIEEKQEEVLSLNKKIQELSISSKQVENLQSDIASKDFRIAQLESMINEMKQAQLMDNNHNNYKKNASGVETLTDIEEVSNDESELFIPPTSPRSGAVTPVATSHRSFT